MKKTMIAMAVAGVVAAPVAMADVTIGGEMRYAVKAVDAGGDEDTTFDDAGSIMFVKGAEDLGNGMKASFFVKLTGIGAGSANTADSWVNLAGDFGSVKMGTFPTPTKTVNRMAETQVFTPASSDSAFAHTSTVDEMIAYTSPSMNGMTLTAAVIGKSEDAASADVEIDSTATNIKLAYANGPLSIAVAQLDLDGTGEDTTSFGIKYNMGDITLAMSQEDTDNSKDDTTLVSATYKMGNNVFAIQDVSGDVDGLDTATSADFEATTYAVTHSMSKRTRVYAQIKDYDNADKDAVILGLKHKF